MTRPHHVGYVVADIPRAVEWAVAALGAGPFFLIEHVPFDEVTYRGEPAGYDHSSAFGQWGALKLELTQFHSATPAGLAEALGRPGPGHVAWLAEDLDAETERLAAAGLTLFHTGRSGPVRAHWFHTPLGHHVEVLERTPELLGFYELMRSAADGWDGADPLRAAAGPTDLELDAALEPGPSPGPN